MNEFREMAIALVAKMTLTEKIRQLSADAPAIERLGVKAYNWWNECLHGLARNGCATVFPQSIALAATFDPDAIRDMADAIGDETRARYNQMRDFGDTLIYQGLTMCCPNVNILRDPRWGRGQETYGEDPYLTGRIGVSFVKGLQGDGKYHKLDANLKHYAVHSGPEHLRHGFNAEVSERDLADTYLWAFRYIIARAAPAAVMTAYSAVNGSPCPISIRLLQEKLRGEFGFTGYVTSDAAGISDLHGGHRATKDAVESAALAVSRGCDLNIGDSSFDTLGEAIARGLTDEETVTRAAVRLFEARCRLGMFSSDCEYDVIPDTVIECDKHRALNVTLARRSIVLVKNEGVLPLKREADIAVIGPNADRLSVLLGNYCGTPSRYTTFLRGIQDACQGRVSYSVGCIDYRGKHPEWAEHPERDAILCAKRSDAVVMIMGLTPAMEGEEHDRQTIALPEAQLSLLNKIAALGKPVVFVNVSGGCVSLSQPDARAAAVIQCFYPGAEGGRALADILFGDVSPSGRLPVTFYASDADLPPFEDYSMENRTYRYFRGEAVYPFGFGLSYTRFAYRILGITRPDAASSAFARVRVENTGETDSETVVQAYLTHARGGADAPIRSLAGFARVFVPAKSAREVALEIEPVHFCGARGSESLLLEVGGSQPDAISARRTGETYDRAPFPDCSPE